MKGETNLNSEELISLIVKFLEEIGLDTIEEELGDNCLLPGLKILEGNILMDSEKLKYPGDLLHEAGHIAVSEKETRSLIGTEKMDPGWPSEGDEIAAILWSYAAARHIGLAPEIVFHPNGYKDESDWILEQLNQKNYIGLPLLEWMGFCQNSEEATAYPNMIKWLR